MEKQYPLRHEPIYRAFHWMEIFKPIFKPCCRCFRTREEQEEYEELKKTKNLQPLLAQGGEIKPRDRCASEKPTKLEKKIAKSDPLVRLGFGVTTFRDTILELIGIFTWISILMSPILYGYI